MPDQMDPETLASAWEIITRGADGDTPHSVCLAAICIVLLDLRDRKMDRIP